MPGPSPTPGDAAVSGEQRFIEDAGLVLEQTGVPRMAGRLLGQLLICDPPHQSAKQLAGALCASAGSISGTTRMLIQGGLIERVSFPGDRRSYFRVKEGAWGEVMRTRVLVTAAFRELAERGLALVGDSRPGARLRLEEVLDFYRFLEEVIPEAVARWESLRREGAAP